MINGAQPEAHGGEARYVQQEEQEQDEDLGLIFMKVIVENGEELLSTLDTDEEAEMVYNAFMEELFEEDEEED